MKTYILEDQQKNQIRIDSEFVTLGRSEKNKIVIRDPAISRHHLNFYIQNDYLLVEDAGSQNGFLVNGTFPGKNSKLKHGDEISFGQNSYYVWETNNPERKISKKNSANHAFASSAKKIDFGVDLSSTPNKLNKRFVIYGVLGILFAVLFLGNKKTDQNKNTNEANNDDPIKSLPTDGFKRDTPALKGPTEVLASSRFREALRDYYQGNYSRAIVGLQDSLALDPTNEESKSYLSRAEILLKNQLDELLIESASLYQGLHYKKSKSLSLEVLTILSEQTPGYVRKLAQDNEQLATQNNNLSHEDIMLRTKCEGMQYEKHCIKALDIMSRCRKHLGEENVLK
jgi:pSer/pThr/pTyr-binding forkhead associated (FHA) protein